MGKFLRYLRNTALGTTGLIALGAAGAYMVVDYFPARLKTNEVAVVENIFEGYSRTLKPGDPVKNWRIRGIETKRIIDTSIRDPIYIGLRPKEGTEGQTTTQYDRNFPSESLMLTGVSGSGEFSIVDIGLIITYQPDISNIKDYVYNFSPQFTENQLDASLKSPQEISSLHKQNGKDYHPLVLRDIKRHAQAYQEGAINLTEALRRATYDKVVRDAGKVALRAATGDGDFDKIITTGRAALKKQIRATIEDILLKSGRTDNHTSGIELVDVDIDFANPPKKTFEDIEDANGNPITVDVMQAYIDVNSARPERDKIIQQAKQQYNQEIPTARGEAQRMVSEAEGAAQRTRNLADAAVEVFKGISEGIKQSGNPNLAYESRRNESIKELLSRMDGVTVMPEGITPLLGLDSLKRKDDPK